MFWFELLDDLLLDLMFLSVSNMLSEGAPINLYGSIVIELAIEKSSSDLISPSNMPNEYSAPKAASICICVPFSFNFFIELLLTKFSTDPNAVVP